MAYENLNKVMIEISKDISIAEHWRAKKIYNELKRIGLNPRYELSDEFTYANIQFVYDAKPYTIRLSGDGEKAQINKVTYRSSPSIFEPFDNIVLYKRHWWY